MNERISRVVRFCLAGVIAASTLSCTLTRHGTLAGRTDPVVINVSVEILGDQAIVNGVNTLTGEQLIGRLTPAHYNAWQEPDDRIGPQSAGFGPGTVPGRGRPPVVGAGVMYLVGDVQGDKGTVLRCTAQVRKTLRMQGEGVCYALSGDRDSVYDLEF